MQRGKRLRSLFVDAEGRLSIQYLAECPTRLPGLVKTFVRTATDLERGGLFVYEEQRDPLLNLAATYRNCVVASRYSLDQMTAHLEMALQERRKEWLTRKR